MNSLDKSIFEEFEKGMAKELKKVKAKSQVKNSGSPTTSWMSKVVEKVRISELACELGVDDCPHCGYGVSFDDGRGFFCCIKRKYENNCSFSGNIVDLMEECG